MTDLLAHIKALKLFAPGATVVVAVSGGADSVALLDLLHRFDGDLRLVVAHLNHSLRGEHADKDQEFVAGLAAGYRLPFAGERREVAALAKEWGTSLEDAGRRARYEFLYRVARAYQAGCIALAHHRDDQAETVLMRLLRGAGATGLRGMGLSRGMLKRPLLRLSRAEIECYLKGRGLTWRTDSSNADTAILRNSIRHELLPILGRYNPKVSERLAATAEILAADEEVLEQVTESAYRRLTVPGATDPSFSVAGLAAEPRGLRLRLYRRALAAQRGDLQRIALSHLEAIDHLVLAERPNAQLKLPGACLVWRGYDRLWFAAPVPAGGAFEFAVAGPGSYRLPGERMLTVSLVERPERLAGASTVAYFDPEAATFPWTVRSFRPGDRFAPLGMAGSQKVKDVFINSKIPVPERGRIPVLISRDRIIWLGGVKMGEQARVTGSLGLVLKAEILDITL
ncbi:tRNA(Ile)-lysidine synthase [Geomonas limicola]|uniref:tRNA(Ile)-lysidine synthase n=1 Tax=Geomonas limicola TaxID=2740186 RepID=A0A6V8N575_9BACT|nr:tRNA lysidine(34) synthetase TilS [Geomonas limicola]GFO66773.1 tRNA(Ile)-lysidine synthase [Geomonas limicola]